MSRTSRYVLMFWAVGQIVLAGALIHEIIYRDMAFNRAADQWYAANQRDDYAGMLAATIAERQAICSGFIRQPDCSEKD